jgi:micrococcal nuclease
VTAPEAANGTVRPMTRTLLTALLTVALVSGCTAATPDPVIGTDTPTTTAPAGPAQPPAPTPPYTHDPSGPADPQPESDASGSDVTGPETGGAEPDQVPSPPHDREPATAEEEPAEGPTDLEAAPLWPVTRVIDGDTIEVAGPDGTLERVRLIGIDTPERGECGFDAATERMRQMVQGRNVTLTPGARSDRDRFGRLLRYVEVDGIDTGYTLIAEGLAISRYDSRDGFGAHPREAQYVAADGATTHPLCPAG